MHDFSRIPMHDDSSRRQVQFELKVNEPGDQYEQEADRVADQVMRAQYAPAGGRASTPDISRLPAISPAMQPQTENDEEEEMLQAKSADGSGASLSADADTLVGRALQGSGQPLPDTARARMEPAFGADFSAVQLHAGGDAAAAAGAVQARAFTTGNDIVFGAGEGQLDTSAGQHLLAHELTHVVQQNGRGGAAPAAREVTPHEDRGAEQPLARLGKSPSDTLGVSHIETSAGYMLQRYPSSRGDWSIRITEPTDPPDIYVPQVSAGYDVDGDLSAPYGLASMFRQGGWYLEGVYSTDGTSKRVGTFHTVTSEGDDVSPNDLQDTTEQGRAYLAIAAQLTDGEWIEDRETFEAYQHGWIRHPRNTVIGPREKVFLNDVFGPVTNRRGRSSNVTMSQSFSQGWSASASTGGAYSEATSSSHGFNASLGGELGKDAAKASGSLGYQYSKSDTQTLTSTINSTMSINATQTNTITAPVEPGEVGALVPWGHTVAMRIPSIKTNSRGWVTDDSGHLVMVGMEVQSVQPLYAQIEEGESESDARDRLQEQINGFTP